MYRKDVAMPKPRDHAPPHDDSLSGDELAAETAVDLPEREAMSTFGHGLGHGIDNFAMPINEATAANGASREHGIMEELRWGDS